MPKTVVDRNTTPKRIHLRMVGSSAAEEARAGAAIRPGDLVDVATTGKVLKHPTAGGPAEKMFACEDALQGRTIRDNYALDELVTMIIPQNGDIVYAWLSGGETTTTASFLTSNGDGALKVATGTDYPIAKALEAVNASDSNDVDERIRVRIL
jgi:hypothetical protein